MKSIKISHKTITIAVIVETICVFVFTGYRIFTLTRNTRNLNTQSQVLQQKIELAGTATSLEAELSKTNASIDTFKNEFFDDETLFVFLRNLSNSALRIGVNINSATFGSLTVIESSIKPPLSTLPVSLNISCDQKGLSNFLAYLETYKNYIVEDSVNFSGTGKGSGSLNITLYVQTGSSGKWSYMGGNP